MRYKFIGTCWAGVITVLWMACLSAASPQQSEAPTERTIHVHTDRMATAPEANDLNERVR